MPCSSSRGRLRLFQCARLAPTVMEEQHGARLMDPLGEAGEEEDAREEATDAAVQQAFSALRHAPAATQQWAAADAPFALHHGEDGGTLLALVSNRAREVGVAALCLDSSSLRLAQFVEAARSSAPITAMLLKLHTPRAVVVLSSSGGGAQQQLPKLPKRRGGPAAAPSAGTPAALAELGGGPGDLLAQLAAHLPDGATFELPRPAFDDTRGRAALEPLSTPQSWAKLAARASTSQGLYLAFAAANALLQHAQASGERVLLAGSLHTELVGTSAHLRMDAGQCVSVRLHFRGHLAREDWPRRCNAHTPPRRRRQHGVAGAAADSQRDRRWRRRPAAARATRTTPPARLTARRLQGAGPRGPLHGGGGGGGGSHPGRRRRCQQLPPSAGAAQPVWAPQPHTHVGGRAAAARQPAAAADGP